MRLIKLEIENLASLDRQGGEVIDFEEGALKDSNIFSIVGPTGSGKSTLLDAICLALYNRAPRYPRKKGDKNQGIEIYGELTSTEKNRLAPTDCRNILTRGRKEGYSKLTFQANNGQLYRAEWHVKFLQVKFAPVTTALYLLRNEQGKRLEVAADWGDLPRIIGLDYEQFLRTVLIAQGSFANFLTAKENDRYELLEKLIGCEDMYAAISGAVKEQKDAAVKAYEHLNAFFTAYEKDLLTDEELEALQKEIGRLEAEERKMKEELSRTNEALSWYGTERKHLANVQQFRWQVAEAQQSLEAAQGDFQRLKWHDETLPGMEIFRDRKLAESNSRRLKGQLEELDKRILQQQDRIREGELALVRLKETESKAWQELERQRPHINRARTLQGELELVRKAVGEKEATWKAGEDGCRKAKRELAENELLIARAQEKRKQSEAAFHRLQAETDRQKKALEEAVLKAKEGLTEVQGKLHGVDVQVLQRTKEEADRRMNDLMNAERLVEDLARIQLQLKENGKSLQQLSAENEALEKEEKGWQVEALAKELETLQQTHTLMTSENWTLHRQGLEEGKPCPLCGSTSHPYTLQEAWIPVAGELQALIGEKRQRLEALKRRQEVVTKTLGVNHGRLQSLQQQQALLSQEREKRMREWQALAEVYRTWTADAEALKGLRPGMMKEAEEAAQRLAGYHATLAEVEKRRCVWEASEENRKRGTEEADRQTRWAEQQLTELHTHLQTEVGKTPHLQQQVAEKEEAVRQAAQEYLKAQQVVKEKEAAWRQEVGDHTPDAWEQELTRAKNEATEAVARQQDGLAQLREGLKGWHGQREATGSNWQREYDQLQEKDGALQAWITAFNEEHTHLPITLGGMEELSLATDNWEEIRRRQLALQTNLTTAQTTLTNEEKALEGHREQKPSQPEEVMAGRKAELESWSNAALTEAKARRQRHEAAKQQMGKLFDQRQAAYQEKLEWEEITEAIGGEGKTLRKIAQCYTLRFLIEHANAEIRKFNSRYELQQVKNSLGIRVIDHDRADDVRDTTSLSGGETFIVSLGLALGLSSLSSRNISFENLFIDEGFGTLDPDTLATVIDSLAMLQSSQGKKVGVISHTDTMSERITTQIRIIKNGHSGSSHLEIYP